MSVDPSLVAGGLTAVVGGVWAYLGSRNRNKVDLVTIAQDAAGRVVDMLHEELDRERAKGVDRDKRIVALEAQDERCRRDLADLRQRIGGLR